jgi:DNA-directed RNA polymerase subunit RPC12/RpoP
MSVISRTITCVECGKEVKINKYKENAQYRCHLCRNKKVVKPTEVKK